MKILLVEDDKIIGENIKEYLEKQWFNVTWETNWNYAFSKILDYDYDLIILDVMLPWKDGFQLAKQLRKLKIQTPIIFLTAKEDIESKEKWFLLWWDDYLTKPFSLKELVLRIRNLLKRDKKLDTNNEIIKQDIKVNLDTKEVLRNWKKIELTPKEFQILVYLMQQNWKVVSKQDILDHVWGVNADIWSDVVRAHIKSLRDKLNKWFEYDPIKTVRWMWFKFEENLI